MNSYSVESSRWFVRYRKCLKENKWSVQQHWRRYNRQCQKYERSHSANSFIQTQWCWKHVLGRYSWYNLGRSPELQKRRTRDKFLHIRVPFQLPNKPHSDIKKPVLHHCPGQHEWGQYFASTRKKVKIATVTKKYKFSSQNKKLFVFFKIKPNRNCTL